jgi:hypothetical protein
MSHGVLLRFAMLCQQAAAIQMGMRPRAPTSTAASAPYYHAIGMAIGVPSVHRPLADAELLDMLAAGALRGLTAALGPKQSIAELLQILHLAATGHGPGEMSAYIDSDKTGLGLLK